MSCILDSMLTFIKDTLAPKKCYSCNTEWQFLCDECFGKQKNFDWFCYICKKKSDNFKIHKKCLIENKILQWKNFNNKKIYLDTVIVLTHYKNPVIKKLITAFKFYGKKGIWRELWKRLVELIQKNSYLNKQDCIILPVPLFFFRKWIRWFNQSAIIWREIGSLLDIRYSEMVIKRRKYTRQQSKLSQEKRINNLDNAFKINKKRVDNIDNKIIFIVDDVVSSWTTLNEISKVLKQNGAKKVIGVCLASN